MSWTPAGTIILKTDWQYTEPVTGEYFRLKHTSAPLNSSYLIAQAQFNSDNSVELLDITELKVTPELQNIYFKKPGIFTNRRIAIKRVTKQPTLESELRRVIRDDLFRDSDFGELSARRTAWTVDIDVSDYVQPVISSGSQSPPQAASPVLTYVSDGDTNGVFYYLGTNSLTTAFTNPATSNLIVMSESSNISGSASHAASNLADRSSNLAHTAGEANAFFKIDLGTNRKLVLTHYGFKGHNESPSNKPRNWVFQGSNNDSEYITLDTQSNNQTIGQGTWFNKSISGLTTGYRFFKFMQTGPDSSGASYLIGQEMELYGTLTTA